MHVETARLNEITGEIIGAAIEEQKVLGVGLLESAYRSCLRFELFTRGFAVETELWMPLEYRSVRVEHAYRLDLLVAGCVVVELKAIEQVHPVHKAQVLTYLRLGGYPLGLLINFHAMPLWKGVSRVANADLTGGG